MKKLLFLVVAIMVIFLGVGCSENSSDSENVSFKVAETKACFNSWNMATLEETKVITPISEALAEDCSGKVTVKGVITYKNGNECYIQDETAGISLYLGDEKQDPNLIDFKYGVSYILTASISVYNGFNRLNIVSYMEEAPDVKINTITNPSDIKLANIFRYVELTDFIVGTETGFKIRKEKGKFKILGDPEALVDGTHVNIVGVIIKANLSCLLMPYYVEDLTNTLAFSNTKTQASLKVTNYTEGLAKADIDLRFGGIISDEAYLLGSAFGVIATTCNLKPICLTIDDLANYEHVEAKNIAKVKDGYQFAWVITNAEGHYSDNLNAYMYIIKDNRVYLNQVNETKNVKAVALRYVNLIKENQLTFDERLEALLNELAI